MANGKNDFSQCPRLEEFPPEYHFDECCWNPESFQHIHAGFSHPYSSEEEQNSKEIIAWKSDVVAYRKFAPYCYYNKPWFCKCLQIQCLQAAMLFEQKLQCDSGNQGLLRINKKPSKVMVAW